MFSKLSFMSKFRLQFKNFVLFGAPYYWCLSHMFSVQKTKLLFSTCIQNIRFSILLTLQVSGWARVVYFCMWLWYGWCKIVNKVCAVTQLILWHNQWSYIQDRMLQTELSQVQYLCFTYQRQIVSADDW